MKAVVYIIMLLTFKAKEVAYGSYKPIEISIIVPDAMWVTKWLTTMACRSHLWLLDKLDITKLVSGC